ncbi:hypothetical protein ACTZWT_08910 [Rhodopseudomonas sp. NSM]
MSYPVIGMLLSVVTFAGFAIWYLIQNQTAITKIESGLPDTAVTAVQSTTGNPLLDSINVYLAKSGKKTNPGIGDPSASNFTMGDASDGNGPYITHWGSDLGPWPTVLDGFTISQLRNSPTPLKGYSQRPLNDYEAGKKLPVIDSFLDVLQNDMQRTIDDGPRFRTNWWNAIKDPANNPKYWDELLAYRDNIKTCIDRIEKLRAKFPQYQDITIAVQPTYWNKLTPLVERFLVAYQYASTSMKSDASREALLFVMNEPELGFEKGLQDFIAWRNRAQGDLLEIRRQASP